MKKRIIAFLVVFALAAALFPCAYAAAPSITILPGIGGSVSLIGHNLTVTPHPGYELSHVEINGQRHEASPNYTLESDTHYTVQAFFFVPEPVWECPYKDVSDSAWYYDAVAFTSELSLMTGMSSDTFAPNLPLTRAMATTILWRIASSPLSGLKPVFSDVPENAWYAQPLSWAVSSGIVTGYDDGSFRPNASISREEFAVLLYRSLSAAIPIEEDVIASFSDADTVSFWAKDAVNWAVKTGLMSGVGTNRLSPRSSCTRAQAATLIMRCSVLELF